MTFSHRKIFELDRHGLWGLVTILETLHPQTPIIKLSCGVCGIKPEDSINLCYINDVGVCKLCVDKDANYG